MFHETFKNWFSWNLMLRYIVKLTVNKNNASKNVRLLTL